MLCVLSGDAVRRIVEAREISETLIGWDAPRSSIDDFLIDTHERKLTGKELIDGARATPPKPPVR